MKHEHRKYYNGSPTLLKLEQDRRDALFNLCDQCTESQKTLFKRMYSHKDLEKEIRSIINDMPYDKLDWAIQQCESTVIKNNKDVLSSSK